ncbi:MAG: hypothetical protein L0Y36_01645 [Planctomycetales bacterium]|nr:hypothetical protein [Planctomycetales bacterium]
MKNCKLILLCLAAVGLLAGQAAAVPVNAGIGISIRAEFQGTDTLAFVAEDGDTIEYIVTVELSNSQFPITDGEPSLTLPDGTVVDLANNLALATGTFIEYPPVAYVVDTADLGQQTGASANEVRALAGVAANSQTGSTVQEVTATTNFDTIVVNPCVEVTKTASCDVAKEGDLYNYTITISNCGGDALTAVSITDTMFGPLLPACATLAPGEDCTIEIPYTVQPGDTDPLENTVTVEYQVTAAPGITVTDTSEAEVDIVHPDFTVTKECLTDNVDDDEVTFRITIDNTGDVPLDFTTDEPEIAPFSLDPGGVPVQMDVTRPVPADATAVENVINVVATLPAEYVCGDNPATIEKSAEDICNILVPDFTVTKECITPEVVPGEMATFLITITNTGDTSLDFVTDEPEIAPFTLAAGAPAFTQEVDRLAVSGTVENTISVTATTVNGTELTGSDTDTCLVLTPDFTVAKNCLTDPIPADANALFEIVICNTGDVALTFEIDDPAAGIVDMLVGPIAATEPDTCQTIQVEVPAECVNGVVSNTATVQAYYDAEPILDPKEATAECPCAGQEGCTPGFWKNHPLCWDCYSTTTKLNQVFSFPASPAGLVALGNKTLLEALSFEGGTTKIQKMQILLRHSVAAVLNACNGDVDYPDDVAGVVGAVNGILANWSTATGRDILTLKNQFQDWNELGCPINAHCDPIPDEVVVVPQ